MADNKEKYLEFCKKTYVPVYSKPWWLDAVCGADRWDVWLYEPKGEVMAAMPYYIETRGNYQYITKPPLTQNNGIIFFHAKDIKLPRKMDFERKVINQACEYINNLDIAVYEQQYHYSFRNWQPFFWNHYECLLRYTYVIENTTDMEVVFDNFTSNYRNKVRKGWKQANISESTNEENFYEEHAKIFSKQGLHCPFSRDLWKRVYKAAIEHKAGKALYARDSNGNVTSLIFVIWDEQSMYQILGGAIPEHSHLESYAALIFHCIKSASEMGIKYDFEGSMIERIARSFAQFGGIPKPYYRIRKVFNPDIIRQEAEEAVRRLEKEKEFNI